MTARAEREAAEAAATALRKVYQDSLQPLFASDPDHPDNKSLEIALPLLMQSAAVYCERNPVENPPARVHPEVAALFNGTDCAPLPDYIHKLLKHAIVPVEALYISVALMSRLAAQGNLQITTANYTKIYTVMICLSAKILLDVIDMFNNPTFALCAKMRKLAFNRLEEELVAAMDFNFHFELPAYQRIAEVVKTLVQLVKEAPPYDSLWRLPAWGTNTQDPESLAFHFASQGTPLSPQTSFTGEEL
eukprot:TRINITY_DN135_c0_g1_i3.p1 TRINITY_DN135_c0_g1~~TRINITY_DN135_c0_g1_i3.p1  ORF type:complete len:286 (-),score=71.90 TRINITY_DN135_c0_g1_i3:178-918(-)